MQIRKLGLYAAVLAGAFCGAAAAAPVVITGYDIENAVISGFGLWGHQYTGTVTPGAAINVLGYEGTLADYSGGTGTLADGMLRPFISDTQLFSQAHAPVITVHFDGVYTLDQLTLFNPGINNPISGNLVALTVTFGGVSLSLNTQAAGPTGQNEFVDFTATSLSGLEGDQMTLSGFMTAGVISQFFSLGEILLEGTAIEQAPATDVPVPASLALLGVALAGLGVARRRRD